MHIKIGPFRMYVIVAVQREVIDYNSYPLRRRLFAVTIRGAVTKLGHFSKTAWLASRWFKKTARNGKTGTLPSGSKRLGPLIIR